LGCLEIKCPYSVDKCVTVKMSPKEIAEKLEDKFYMRKSEDESYTCQRIMLKYKESR